MRDTSIQRWTHFWLPLTALVLICIAVAPDLSGRYLTNDLNEASPRSISRVLRHLDRETRLDADIRLIPFLSHADDRTRERVLRHLSRLNSPTTPAAILDAYRDGHFEQDDAVAAIRRIDNPLSRRPIEAWLSANDPDGTIRAALADHLADLESEEILWGAAPYNQSLIDAQLSVTLEGSR
jgi:hypothetical protein